MLEPSAKTTEWLIEISMSSFIKAFIAQKCDIKVRIKIFVLKIIEGGDFKITHAYFVYTSKKED